MKRLLLITVLTLLMASTAWAAGNFPMPTICDRTCWAARTPQCAITQEPSLNRAVIHHTEEAADYDTTSLEFSAARVRAHQNYHMDGHGWCDIGYHFLVDKLGNRFEGREGSISSMPRGSHDGVNTCSMGFSCMGDFRQRSKNSPTVEIRQCLYDLIAWKIPDPFTGFGGGAYGSVGTCGFICGHWDVASTTCPGEKLYVYITTDLNGGEARLEVWDRISGGAPTPTPTPTPPPGTEVIVDNDGGAPGYTETGTWQTSNTSGYNGGTYRYASTGKNSTATWTASLIQAGTWNVSVIYLASANRSTGAKFIVHAATGDVAQFVDQTTSSLAWVSLGDYSFNAGNNTVTLDALNSVTGAKKVVIADAVKFTLVP